MNVHDHFSHLFQKGGKETILEEDLEFKGIEEEEESLADIERSSAEGDKDKGEKRLKLVDLQTCVTVKLHYHNIISF